MRANVWFLCTAGLLFVIFADALVGIFTDDPLVARYGADALRYVVCELQTGTQDIRLPVQAISPFTAKAGSSHPCGHV